MLVTEAGHPELADSDGSVSIEALSAESTEVSWEDKGAPSGPWPWVRGKERTMLNPKDKAVVRRSEVLLRSLLANYWMSEPAMHLNSETLMEKYNTKRRMYEV